MNRDVFSTYNPAVIFLFYIAAIVFGMVFIHPVFLACSCLMAAGNYLTVRGAKALKLIVAMIPVFIFISVLNPLFNTLGSRVMFTYLGGRPYTFEALCYGMAIGAMFVTIILWFASYNLVMTSDKFLYVFGRTIPSISLVLTMVLRLVPNYQRKAMQISGARRAIGKAGKTGDRRQQAENGMTIVSALTGWALEGGIVTADSMRSRGYGCGRRTSFSVYGFGKKDRLLFGFMLLLIAVILICSIKGAAETAYTPVMAVSEINDIYGAVGIAAYTLLLGIPAAVNIAEEITWRILKSGI